MSRGSFITKCILTLMIFLLFGAGMVFSVESNSGQNVRVSFPDVLDGN